MQKATASFGALILIEHPHRMLFFFCVLELFEKYWNIVDCGSKMAHKITQEQKEIMLDFIKARPKKKLLLVKLLHWLSIVYVDKAILDLNRKK